jgi:hypothetical protein
MPPDPSQARINLEPVQDALLVATSVIRDEVQRLFDVHSNPDAPATMTLKQLFWYLSSRTQAATFLVSWDFPWDAEIVLRSFYETGAKIVFICLAPPDQVAALIDEYWDALGSAGDKRRTRKAEFAETLFKENADSARIFSFLRKPSASRTTARTYSKAERKAIEQKWSFSEIIETLDRYFPEAKSLLHGYGLASHLLHADPGALELMMDRALREPAELVLLRGTHACRIFSDLAWLNYLCAASLKKHLNGEFRDEPRMNALLEELEKQSKPIRERFARSQDGFYRK